MMKSLLMTTLVLLGTIAPGAAQDHSAHSSPAAASSLLFEHYEGVRRALSSDKLADVAPHAKQLAASVESIGGPDAKKHADAVLAATTLDETRKHFGELSTILVPIFVSAKIQGATAFMCPMKKQPWMQKGDKMENPYYGKSMATCGSPYAGTGQ
jgi:hypothetical protein